MNNSAKRQGVFGAAELWLRHHKIFGASMGQSVKLRHRIARTSSVGALVVQRCVRQFVLVTVVAALLLALGVAYAGTRANSSDVYITITAGNQATHFAIPKTYLNFTQNERGGNQDIVVLSVSLPDVQPDFSEHYFHIMRAAVGVDGVPVFREQTDILLSRGRPNVKRLFRREIEAMTHNTGEELFGLRRFTYIGERPMASKNGYFKGIVFYLLPPKNVGSHGQYFECYTKEFLKNWKLPTKCLGTGNYNENLYYRYNIRKENLEHWKILDTNVRALLDLFERRATALKYRDSGG